MLLATYSQPWDFELLDTGDGYRLERWNKTILSRPDPQIIWPKTLPENEWQKANAVFVLGTGNEKGKWDIKFPIPEPWILNFQNVKFLLKLSPFKHTGLFAEQAAQWDWMTSKLKVYKVSKVESKNTDGASNLELYNITNIKTANKFKILNLFAYTGAASVVLAKAGCQVTHVDASKPAITWANENHKLNNLPANSVRWILDDAAKFAAREVKRGAKYDGIIMDPPAFGHSPTGKIWKFNDDLPALLADCVRLLSANAKFLIINGYATNSSALALNNLLEDAIKLKPGSASWRIEFGELCLKQKSGRMVSTGIFSRWSG